MSSSAAYGERLDALGLAPRAELLHVLMLPDLARAERIGETFRRGRSGGAPRSLGANHP